MTSNAVDAQCLEPVDEFLGRTLRFFALVALIPLLVGFISSWSFGLGLILFILAIPTTIITVIIGAIMWFARGIRLARGVSDKRNRLSALGAAPFFCICLMLSAWPLLGLGSFFGSLSRLFVNQTRYEAIIAKVTADQSPAWYEEQGGIIYSADLGPPVRVAFNPAGMLDNWSGIIYDPTGDVMLANGFDPATGKFVAPDRVTKLFGGDLVVCRHLWSDYHDCSFT